MIYHHPRARTDLPRPSGSLGLAVSAHVWFDTVDAFDVQRRPVAPTVAPETLATANPILPRLPSDRPLIMGIVNVTPDSFSDGGRYAGTKAAIDHCEKLLAQGAIPGGNTPEQFNTFIDAEHVKWAQVVKVSGAKVD